MSAQVISILKEVKPLTSHDVYVFPKRGGGGCMSDGTINKALRKIGYCTKTEQDAHGFRGLAVTQLYEQGVNPQYIELQQSHPDGSSVSRAYNFIVNIA